MYRYFIKSFILLLVCSSSVIGQTDQALINSDSTTIRLKYGLRLGADLSKFVRSVIDDNYQGFEVNGDYRLTERLYIAGELGNEQRTLSNDALNVTSKGSYFKAGVDYNLYRNWLDMENMIFSGFRVGISSFSQTLNSGVIYDINNQYFNNQQPITPDEFNGLSAIWGEIILGVKTEVLTNLFMGLNFQLKFLVTETSPDNFENLYIPGFNRTYDSGIIGAGFGYNISYLIPIFKKDKSTKKQDTEKDNEDTN